MRRVGGEEQELKDGEVLIVRCRSVYIRVYVLYNIPNILSSTATTAISWYGALNAVVPGGIF